MQKKKNSHFFIKKTKVKFLKTDKVKRSGFLFIDFPVGYLSRFRINAYFQGWRKKNELFTGSQHLFTNKGKDIGNILSSSRYYKINSAIRKKLGLGPTETNLDIYLKNLSSGIESSGDRQPAGSE